MITQIKKIGVAVVVLACVYGGIQTALAWTPFSNKNIVIALESVFLSSRPAYALSQETQTIKSAKWPHESSDLEPDPAIFYGVLENGFRYVIMENKKPEHRVSVNLLVQAGSINEQDHEQGVAHFLEHMMFNGSTHFKPGELVKYFQSIGMNFGNDANAHTGFNETVYDIVLPSGDLEHIENAFTVIKDYAQGALLLPVEVEKELKVVLAEMRSRDSASFRTLKKTLAFEFPDALISKRLPIGKREVLEKADRVVLKGFYDKWYRPDNMVLVLVGDFDGKMVKKQVEQFFSDMRERAEKSDPPEFGSVHHTGLKTFYHYEQEAGGTSVSIESIRTQAKVHDSFELQRKILVQAMANQMVQNRLDAIVKQPDSPFTSASIGSGVFLNQIHFAEISADCDKKNWENTIEILEKTLRSALTHGFTMEELLRIKKDYSASFDTAAKKASTRNSRGLARSIIRHLNRDRVLQSPEQEKELLMPVLEEVSVEQANQVFKEIWQEDNRLVLVTGDARLDKKEKSPEKTLEAVYLASADQAVSMPDNKKAAVFPYLPKPSAKGKIVDKKVVSDLGVTLVQFENGVRLNLKKTDFKANEVISSLVLGHGRAQEPEKYPGLSLLAQDVLNESGLGQMDQVELERALAGKNTGTSVHIGDSYVNVVGNSVTNEVDLLFQLYHAFVLDPGIRQDALDLTLKRLKQEYQSLSHKVNGRMKLQGRRFLAGGDNRFGMPPFEALEAIGIEEINQWIRPFLDTGKIEISVVGDIDVDAVIDAASIYFGSMDRPARSKSKMREDLPYFPEGETLTIQVDTKIENALVVAAWPSEDFMNIHRTRRLSILADIFSEKLREEIREKLGASYSPFAFNAASRVYKGYGVFQAFVQVNPDQTEDVLNAVEKIAEKLQKNGVTTDDVKRSLDPVITSIREMRKSNSYWLNSVLKGSTRHPQQLEWSKSFIKDYQSITPEEISTLAATYLDDTKQAVVIIKPAE